MAKKTVVLFEDDKAQLKKLVPAFATALRSEGVTVFPFTARSEGVPVGETYEMRLKEDLAADKLGEIALFVTDRDL